VGLITGQGGNDVQVSCLWEHHRQN
jgi:hypothetical protein